MKPIIWTGNIPLCFPPPKPLLTVSFNSNIKGMHCPLKRIRLFQNTEGFEITETSIFALYICLFGLPTSFSLPLPFLNRYCHIFCTVNVKKPQNTNNTFSLNVFWTHVLYSKGLATICIYQLSNPWIMLTLHRYLQNTYRIQQSNSDVLDDAVQCHEFKHTEGSY